MDKINVSFNFGQIYFKNCYFRKFFALFGKIMHESNALCVGLDETIKWNFEKKYKKLELFTVIVFGLFSNNETFGVQFSNEVYVHAYINVETEIIFEVFEM